MPLTITEQMQSTPEGMKAWNQEKLKFDIGSLICEVMAEKKVSRAKLSRLLGVTKGRVSQMLDGQNLCLATIADALTVLGLRLVITKESIESITTPTESQL